MGSLGGLALNIGLALTVLLATYFIGSAIERRHYNSIRDREKKYRAFPVINFNTVLPEWQVESTELAQGSIVVSIDYFKRFVAVLRALIGGRIKTYEPLLDRARREAMLRMIENARASGCGAVINVRLETSRLANATRSGERVAGVEMLAYGTGLRLKR